MAYEIKEIQGIGAAFAEKLSAAKIGTTDDLLKLCCTAKGRKEVAQKTGVSETHLLKWSNLADLMRISGVGPQYSELLEAAGVDTIKELRTRNAESLAAKMKEINEKKKLAKVAPATTVIQGWVEKAKQMEPKISH
jgi:predicted flap endonuclease-1-like 5' DNA nuclease